MIKKILLMVCVILIPLQGFAPQQKAVYIAIEPPIEPYKALWDAVSMVESSMDSMAYNVREQATGIVQIRPIRLRDYNTRTGNRLKLSDMYSVKISKEIFFYFATKYHYTDYETIAKKWNGSGHKTIIYWQKIKKQLEKDGKIV